MNKQAVLQLLNDSGVPFEITEHGAVFNMKELSEAALPWPDAVAKNLFVRDDRKQAYLLISVKGDKKIDLKEFRKKYGFRPLSFASPDELSDILRLTPGSVSPLGLLNDDRRLVRFFLDREFTQPPEVIGCHPCDNTATVRLRVGDLLRLITGHGTRVDIFDADC